MSIPSFYGGFDLGSITGGGAGGNKNWYAKQEAGGPGRISLVWDGDGGYFGRFQVNNGDGDGGMQNAEVVNMQTTDGGVLNEDLASGTQVYRFRVKFDSPWPAFVLGDYATFVKLHGPDELQTNPNAWELSATSNGIVLGVHGGDVDLNPGQFFSLEDGGLVSAGLWMDWIVTVKYGNTSSTGAIKVERKTQGEQTFTTVLNLPAVATLQFSANKFDGGVGPHYVKLGLHTNFNTRTPTRVVYHDAFTREPGFGGR